MTILVAGAGGFIGGHLVRSLLDDGYSVRAIDIKPVDEWYQVSDQATNVIGDCSLLEVARTATAGVEQVYNLAADMGGIGFIENN